MAAFKDYYSILGVPKTATRQEIRSAFRKAAAANHPDRNPDDPEAEERFKEINEAYGSERRGKTAFLRPVRQRRWPAPVHRHHGWRPGRFPGHVRRRCGQFQ
ncbi:MAG TPA: DnaJ domain-containing protein [Deinococcales bacterium]|nr:DnaJ domain-containing protein [Deinococcales bacterium]